MPVPRTDTQPPADELIDYDDFVARLSELAASPRVKIECKGRSHGGRGLYNIVVAAEDVINRLDYHQSLAAAAQRPVIAHESLARRRQSPPPEPPDDLRFPVMILGESFGHEASHVEALLQLAEKLAAEDSAEVAQILSKLIVCIVPMSNPDGREEAIELWREHRLAEDSAAAGNHYGFYINRDFLHLTQPEGRAALKIYQEWHPLVTYDTHEDMFLLGVVTDEVCWCPAFGTATVGKAQQNIHDTVDRIAQAIKTTWDAEGYHYLESDMFAQPMLGQPADKPHWMWAGDLVRTMALHGNPAIITESARTPGTQTWRDRNRQKVTAGMALLGEVARTAGDIAAMIYSNSQVHIENGGADAYILPKSQLNRDALAYLIGVLLQHDISVYETNMPEPAYVVPLAQAEASIALTLLSSGREKLAAMPPALGVDAVRLSDLPEPQRGDYAIAHLRPLFEAPVPRVTFGADKNDMASAVVIPNAVDGIRLVNRLLARGLPVSRLMRAAVGLQAGCFIVRDLPRVVLEGLVDDLHLDLESATDTDELILQPLSRRVIGLYVGQGVDRPDSVLRAEMRWALKSLEFDFAPLESKDIRAGGLDGCDVLLVPDGNARDIVHGWQLGSHHKTKGFDLPGAPDGIGDAGLSALRAFVAAGGHYVGIGSGGGLLATPEYADLINLDLAYHSLGSARVILNLSDSPLAYGLRGYRREDGAWQPDLCPAMFYTESLVGEVGGPIFKTSDPDVEIVARFHYIEFDPDDHFVVQPERFAASEGGVAVASAAYDSGRATVIGVRPGFRAYWTHSNKLLSNAIFAAAGAE